MRDEFSHTLRALEGDGFRRTLWILVALAALVCMWLSWFLLARVQVYEVSHSARLERARAVHAIEAPTSGRVVESHLALNREFQAGDVIVALDAEGKRLRLEEQRRRLESFEPQLDALEAQIRAQQQALDEEVGGTQAALQEARARAREAEAPRDFAENELQRIRRLHAEGQVSDAELARATRDAEAQQAAAESARAAVRRLESERAAAARDREASLEQLRREVERVEGERAGSTALIERLEHEMEESLIRAPVSGRLVEAVELEAGAFVSAGDRLGVIMAPGRLRAVAEFRPSDALGRIRIGQTARMRLEGFPWAQFGTLRATVSGVASELRDGLVRVELEVHPDPASAIPLQHGLPGALEVETERVSPAVLVLRAAGRLLARPVDSSSG